MDAQDYIGKKWVSGAKGPDSFDCWGMVQHWYLKNLNHRLPDFPAGAEDILAIARTFDGEQNSPRWREFPAGELHSIVAMGKNSKITHVGVCLSSNLVLHCARDSGRCVVQTMRQIRAQWKIVKFYFPNDTSHTVQ